MESILPWFKRRKVAHHPASETNGEESKQQSTSTDVPSFPEGVKVLHDVLNATVDICFIHGLTGNRISTWTAEGASSSWPESLLPETVETARILTWGYDAYVIHKLATTSQNRLIDHAINFLNDLTTDRAACNAESRPLILVTHSMGGLVCKEALLQSRDNPEAHLRDVFTSVKGIIFMGTPHKGSWMAGWAKIPVSALGFVKSVNSSLLEILRTNDQTLELIQINFWSMIREQRERGRKIEVTCFFEELGVRGVGPVVSKDSATLESYALMSIHANHANMVKFASAEDNGFKRVVGVLGRWESQIGMTDNSSSTI